MTDTAPHCPTDANLLALLASESDRPEDAGLFHHLQTCDRCLQRLDELSLPRLTLGQKLRSVLGPALTETDHPAEAVTRLGPDSGVEAAPPPDVDTTPVLANHRLLGRLGAGGMGDVLLAEHVDFKVLRAIKIASESIRSHPQAVDRFHRECKIALRLEHPHLVRTHDAGRVDDFAYLVMEYVDGPDLQRVITHHEGVSLGAACEVLAQVASALVYLERSGWVHRDIKPSNLVVDSEGVVKLLDFGLARAVSSDVQTSLTGRWQVVGSPYYMAPELFQKSQSAGPASDVYSLGCTAYHLLTGQIAHRHESDESPLVIAGRHHSGEFIPLLKRRPDLPAPVADLVTRMLAVDPSARPSEIGEVLRVVSEYADRTELVASITNVPRPDCEALPEGLSLPSLDALTETTARSEPVPQPHRSRSIGLVVACLLVGVGIIVFTLSRKPADDPPRVERRSPVAGDAPAVPQPPPLPFGGHFRMGKTLPVGLLEESDARANTTFGPAALVSDSQPLADAERWTIETEQPRGRIEAVRLSPSREHIAVGGYDGAVRVYTRDWQLTWLLLGHVHVTSLRWVRDDALIVSGEEGAVRLWRLLPEGRASVVREWPGDGVPVWDADLSEDGTHVAIAATKQLRIGSVAGDSQELAHVRAFTWALQWHSDGDEHLCLLGHAGGLRVVDTLGNSRLDLDGHSERVQSIDCQPGGKLVACTAFSGSPAMVIDRVAGRIVEEFECVSAPERDVRWSPDGRRLAIGHGGGIIIWDAETGRREDFPLPGEVVAAVDWWSDTELLVGLVYGSTVGLYNLQSRSLSTTLHGSRYAAPHTFWPRAGEWIGATAEALTRIIPDRIEVALVDRTAPQDPVRTIATVGGRTDLLVFGGQDTLRIRSPDGSIRTLPIDGKSVLEVSDASVARERAVFRSQSGDLWEVDSAGSVRRLLRTPRGGSGTDRLAWSPDGRELALLAHNTLRVWKEGAWDEPPWSPQQPYSGGVLTWTPDGREIVTGGLGGIRFINRQTGQVARRLTGQKHWTTGGCGFSADGRYFAAITDTRLRLWETEDWTTVTERPTEVPLQFGHRLVWSPEGNVLCHATSSGVFRFVDAPSLAPAGCVLALSPARWAVFDATGDWHATPAFQAESVAVVATETGQQLRPLSVVEQFRVDRPPRLLPSEVDVPETEPDPR